MGVLVFYRVFALLDYVTFPCMQTHASTCRHPEPTIGTPCGYFESVVYFEVAQCDFGAVRDNIGGLCIFEGIFGNVGDSLSCFGDACGSF